MDSVQHNLVTHVHSITRQDRASAYGYKPKLIWLTGLSGSGKSTLASALERHLFNQKKLTYVLDGDNVRQGLNKDLDFSLRARKENIRRISEVAKLFVDAGAVVITAFISPLVKDRQAVKDLLGAENFLEIFVDCPLEVCEQRDVKGLYKKARAGEIADFTGISSPFEMPTSPDVRVDTSTQTVDECVAEIIAKIEPRLAL